MTKKAKTTNAPARQLVTSEGNYAGEVFDLGDGPILDLYPESQLRLAKENVTRVTKEK